MYTKRTWEYEKAQGIYLCKVLLFLFCLTRELEACALGKGSLRAEIDAPYV
jgi:hypothetical protein